MTFDEEVAARLRRTLARKRGIEERRMFGGLAYLKEGRMFVGIVGDDLMVRVGKARHAEAMAKPHVRPMDFTGRPMEGYVFVAPPGFSGDADLQGWIGMALDHVATLAPPKAGKGRP